jgi:pyruvate kinase
MESCCETFGNVFNGTVNSNLDWYHIVDLRAQPISFDVIRKKKIKVVATIGPACSDEKILRTMIQNGMDVARLNFSHGSHGDHKRRLELLRRAAKAEGKHLGLLQDIQGPKIRVGRFKTGSVNLKKGKSFIITTEKILGDELRVSCTHGSLHKEIKAGDRVLLDDGLIFLIVDKVKDRNIYTTVIFGGVLKDSKGMNLPDTRVDISCLTPKDRADLAFGLRNHVDFIALSFIQTAEDVVAARRIIDRVPNPPLVIAKIESAHAIHDLDAIIQVSDGVMVARGDLGVECPLEQVPALQKEIIRAANKNGKFVITATQMLESMTSKPRPTRAEASDVANAVMDGTDAVMLSAETASGDFPVESVKTMSRIIIRTEEYMRQMPVYNEALQEHTTTVTSAVTAAALQATNSLDTSAIVAFTHSGATAQAIARLRPSLNIFALTPFDRICRKLSVVYGVIPSLIRVMKHTDEMPLLSKPVLKRYGLWKSKTHIVILSGTPVARPGSTNLLKLHLVK